MRNSSRRIGTIFHVDFSFFVVNLLPHSPISISNTSPRVAIPWWNRISISLPLTYKREQVPSFSIGRNLQCCWRLLNASLGHHLTLASLVVCIAVAFGSFRENDEAIVLWDTSLQQNSMVYFMIRVDLRLARHPALSLLRIVPGLSKELFRPWDDRWRWLDHFWALFLSSLWLYRIMCMLSRTDAIIVIFDFFLSVRLRIPSQYQYSCKQAAATNIITHWFSLVTRPDHHSLAPQHRHSLISAAAISLSLLIKLKRVHIRFSSHQWHIHLFRPLTQIFNLRCIRGIFQTFRHIYTDCLEFCYISGFPCGISSCTAILLPLCAPVAMVPVAMGKSMTPDLHW
jgi:hypothetical protein